MINTDFSPQTMNAIRNGSYIFKELKNKHNWTKRCKFTKHIKKLRQLSTADLYYRSLKAERKWHNMVICIYRKEKRIQIMINIWEIIKHWWCTCVFIHIYACKLINYFFFEILKKDNCLKNNWQLRKDRNKLHLEILSYIS